MELNASIFLNLVLLHEFDLQSVFKYSIFRNWDSFKDLKHVLVVYFFTTKQVVSSSY